MNEPTELNSVRDDPCMFVVTALQLLPDDPAEASTDDLELLRVINDGLQRRGAELLERGPTSRGIVDRELLAAAHDVLTTYAQRAVEAHDLTLDQLVLGESTPNP